MMKYPIGIQSFPDIREREFVYVDKTAFVYRMALMGKFYSSFGFRNGYEIIA